MVECGIYEDGLGYFVDPESDTKEVFIPSPPTMSTVKINPRSAIIYISGGVVKEGWDKLEALKDYAEKQKVAFVCPFSNDPEEVAKSYEWLHKKCRLLNIKRGEYSVKADSDNLGVAQDVVDYLVDECDADIDDAKELDF